MKLKTLKSKVMEQEVIYKKKITQCRECPNCKIEPDYSDDWFNDDDEKATCLINNKEIDCALRPHEEIDIPNWCPLLNNNYENQ